MSDTYVECLVKQKQSGLGKFLKYLLIMLTVVFAILMLIIPLAFIIAVAAGIGVYFVNMFTDLEYEFHYLDKEMVVD